MAFSPLHVRFLPLYLAQGVTLARRMAGENVPMASGTARPVSRADVPETPSTGSPAPSYNPSANLTLAERKRRGDTGSRSGSLR